MGTPASDKAFHLQYCSYRRPFDSPLVASWGTWSVREGLLLRLEQKEWGCPRFGEIAPLPEFGSESIETARAFMESMGEHPSERDIQKALEVAPVATAYGLSSLLFTPLEASTTRTAALFSLSEFSPEWIRKLSSQGFMTFKVKLGMGDPEEEWEQLQSLVSSLADGQQLRLDPNRSWDELTWRFWKDRLPEISAWIEFLEEPFCQELSTRQWLNQAEKSPVKLALDESLSSGSLTGWSDIEWPGFWIIKPSLLGNPAHWMSPLSKYRDRVIISSVFETGIGLSGLIYLAKEFSSRDHGLGTQSRFNDSFKTLESGANLIPLEPKEQEAIWNKLSGY